MLRRYYGKISRLPIDQFKGNDGELVVDDETGNVYVMDGVTLGGTQLGVGGAFTGGNIVADHVDATIFHAKTGIGNGFAFIDEVHNTISGMVHSNLSNSVRIFHEGNVGLSVYANGATEISNVILNHVETFTNFNNSIKVENVTSSGFFVANVGFNRGYNFNAGNGNVHATSLVHNDFTNQLQLVQEGGVVGLNSNGSL